MISALNPRYTIGWRSASRLDRFPEPAPLLEAMKLTQMATSLARASNDLANLRIGQIRHIRDVSDRLGLFLELELSSGSEGVVLCSPDRLNHWAINHGSVNNIA